MMMDEFEQIINSPRITIDGDSIEVEDLTTSSSITSVVPRRVHMSYSSCSSLSTFAETGAKDLSKSPTKTVDPNQTQPNHVSIESDTSSSEESPSAGMGDLDNDKSEFEKEYTSFPVETIHESDYKSIEVYEDEVSDITMYNFDHPNLDMLDFSQRLMPEQTPRRRRRWSKVQHETLKAASPTPGRYHRPVDSLLPREDDRVEKEIQTVPSRILTKSIK